MVQWVMHVEGPSAWPFSHVTGGNEHNAHVFDIYSRFMAILCLTMYGWVHHVIVEVELWWKCAIIKAGRPETEIRKWGGGGGPRWWKCSVWVPGISWLPRSRPVFPPPPLYPALTTQGRKDIADPITDSRTQWRQNTWWAVVAVLNLCNLNLKSLIACLKEKMQTRIGIHSPAWPFLSRLSEGKVQNGKARMGDTAALTMHMNEAQTFCWRSCHWTIWKACDFSCVFKWRKMTDPITD